MLSYLFCGNKNPVNIPRYLPSTPLAALLLRGDKVMLQRVANNWSFAHNVCVCRAAARASAHLLAALPALCTQRVLLQLLLPRQWNYIVLLPANKKRYWADGCIDSFLTLFLYNVDFNLINSSLIPNKKQRLLFRVMSFLWEPFWFFV